MIPRRLLFVSLALVFVTSLILAQKTNPSAQTNREGGLTVATFETRQGSIRVSLPADMTAGDTISGTVVAEPSGKDDQDKQKNTGTLNGYVIDIENQKTKVSSGVMQRILLAPDLSAPRLILLDEKGNPAGTIPIRLQPATTTAGPSAFSLPALGQTGRPMQIQGPFDGDSSNTKVQIGTTPLRVLAESPRQVVAESPRDVVGPTNITVNENGASATGSFRNLKIDLTAPKTSLLKGESTELHVEVQGLEGLSQPVQVQLQNRSPSTVNLAGGNTQTIPIQPSQVTTDGTFNWSGTLTGVGAGGFNITGSLPTDVTTLPSPSPGASNPTTTPTPTAPTTTPPPTRAQTRSAAMPSPSPVTSRTSPQVFPTPIAEERFNNSYTKTDTDCCKKFLNKDNAFEIQDDKGNSFRIFRNTLTMKIDGKEYEWEFTQDGKPLYIEWMFCHLNDHMIISQTSEVLIRRVKGGNTNESGSTSSVSLHGPYRDEHSRRASYGFQFEAQKLGTKTGAKEYGVAFSMDAEKCDWSCQIIAEGKVLEFRTDPPRSPAAIFNDLNQSVDIPSGTNDAEQREWWNVMYRYLFEIEDWLLWINNTRGSDLDETNRAYNAWRARLANQLEEMAKSAKPEDIGRIEEMLQLLRNTSPSPEDIKRIGEKFDALHLRYGTNVREDIRRMLLAQP